MAYKSLKIMICDFKTVFYNLCKENSLEKDYALIYDNR